MCGMYSQPQIVKHSPPLCPIRPGFCRGFFWSADHELHHIEASSGLYLAKEIEGSNFYQHQWGTICILLKKFL